MEPLWSPVVATGGNRSQSCLHLLGGAAFAVSDDAGDERTCARPSRERPHSLPRPSCRPRYLRRGVEPEGTERVRVSGRDATLVVWSPDYDGKGKAWVRFDDGTDAIIGGSRVER
jgi:hypothetical protein